MGKQHENDVAKQVYRESGDHIKAYRCGYSGSNAMPQPDVLVTTPSDKHGFEMKGPVDGDTIAIEEGGLEQLVKCRGPNTMVYLYVKFQRRMPLIVKYLVLSGEPEWNGPDMSVAEQFARLTPDCFNPRVNTSDETGVTRLYLDKPSTSDWPSSRKGDGDAEAILSCL